MLWSGRYSLGIAAMPLTYVNSQVSDYGNVYVADEVRRMVEMLAVDV